jgi:heme-degrading monooxygenase HmoA
MFIAMNRFKVLKGQEEAFEEVWRGRSSRLDEMKGFLGFHLLRGPEAEDHPLYASHTMWANRAAFEAWTRSQQFRDAHKDAGQNKPLYIGHPQFEGFTAVQGA